MPQRKCSHLHQARRLSRLQRRASLLQLLPLVSAGRQSQPPGLCSGSSLGGKKPRPEPHLYQLQGDGGIQCPPSIPVSHTWGTASCPGPGAPDFWSSAELPLAPFPCRSFLAALQIIYASNRCIILHWPDLS